MTKSKAINSKIQHVEIDPQSLLSDWVKAIHDFNQWNSRVVDIIDAHISISEDVINPLGRLGNQRSMADLIQLRLALVDILDKLINDINTIERENDTLSKIENLRQQTRVILQWNEKIRQTLETNSCGIA